MSDVAADVGFAVAAAVRDDDWVPSEELPVDPLLLVELPVLSASSEDSVTVLPEIVSCRVLGSIVLPNRSVVSGGSVVIAAASTVTVVVATPCFVSTQKQ